MFHDRTQDLTRELSRTFGSALLVQYDDRIGLREAVVYRAGEPTHRFGLSDELWVPLDELGNPRRDVPHVRTVELDPAEEYETVVSAIDHGLEAFGVNPPLNATKLRDMILHAPE
jgi:hypothetical protein